MAFLTIRIECPERDPAVDPNRAHTLRKTLASLLELELRRDFEVVNLTLHEEAEGHELVVACRSPHDITKLSEAETKFLNDLNEMMADSPYRINASGSVYRDDTQLDVPGVGCDWRAVMRAVNQQGPGMLPGIVASIIDGAEEVEQKEREKGAGDAD